MDFELENTLIELSVNMVLAPKRDFLIEVLFAILTLVAQVTSKSLQYVLLPKSIKYGRTRERDRMK
jgi:hypothetical protein